MDKKIYVVNGASGGIGATLSKEICERGGKVIGIGRDKEALNKLASDLEDFVPYLIEDVASDTEAIRFLDFIQKEYSNTIDSYIHLAGIFIREIDPVSKTKEIWDITISTNLTGTYVWNKTFIEYFSTAGIQGSIVNTSSQAAFTGGFGPNFSYAASKGAVISLTKSLSRYCAQFKIRVNVVVPGFVDNDMMLNGLSNEMKKEFIDKTQLKRLATNKEVATACLFLASSESNYSTGITLDVTGGLLDV
jgi:NAD(P)-dependent dehydrogenase (short-subunit alcohol dehydrogenase family)